MNIIVSANSKYVRYLYVMLLSLLENNKGENISVYVMQCDFTEKDKSTIAELVYVYGQNIKYLFVDVKQFIALPTSEKFSYETYFRLIMAELLPKNVRKILYLDVDIIVRGNLKQLYTNNIDKFIAGVCQDTDHPILEEDKQKLFQREGDLRYFNAGVMLWNVERLRQEFDFHRFLDAAKKLGYHLQYADQEILNYLLYDKVFYLSDRKYNYMVRGDVKEDDLLDNDVVILHYAGCNPWQNGKKNDLYHIWWRYAKKTPFYVDLLEEQLWREFGFGSEKEAEILRDVEWREIYEHAFRLKGTGHIKKYLDHAGYYIGIYGAGKMAEVLYKLLFLDGLWDRVKAVVDWEKEGEFHDITIQKDITRKDKILWIVTPVYRTQTIINDLRGRPNVSYDIISLREWLKKIE